MPDPEKSVVTEKEKPAPHVVLRLTAWFAIYIAAVALIVTDFFLALAGPPAIDKMYGEMFFYSLLVAFLGFPVLGFAGGCSILLEIRSSLLGALLLEAVVILTYGIFIASFGFVCRAKTQKGFVCTIAALLVLAVGNLTACHCENEHRVHQPKEPDY